MKQQVLCAMLLAAMALGACNNVPPSPTASAPTLQIPDPPTLAPTNTSAALATLPPAPTAGASPTVELVATASPSAEAAATEPPPASPTPEAASPTPEPTAEPTLAPVEDQMAAGQRDTAALGESEHRSYLYSGTRFQPAVFFVEPEGELDVQLLALAGQLSPGSGLDSVTPLASADNALAGRPEIVVLSPETTGPYTFVVRSMSGAGPYTAFLFDLTSPATGMAVQQADILAAGETKRYDVTSNGPRPVIVMADPTDLSDLAVDIFGADGTLLTTANFSGAGGVEVAYVLPLGTTGYTVAVREATGGAAAYNVAVVTLE